VSVSVLVMVLLDGGGEDSTAGSIVSARKERAEVFVSDAREWMSKRGG
jgi:hypothetical protein